MTERTSPWAFIQISDPLRKADIRMTPGIISLFALSA